MKKTGIMNQGISSVVAGMGHNDMIMVCGSAYPIPEEGNRIDLALEPGLPGFEDVVRVILKELEVKRFYVSEKTQEASPGQLEKLCRLMPGKEPDMVSQAELMKIGGKAKAYVRTGECTPFSNVILVGGVIF